MKKKQLTEKQDRFCREFLVDLNGTKAAIRAGYSKKTAQEIASENLSKPIIQARLQELRKPVEDKLSISFEWVLQRFKDISDRCMTVQRVMEFDPVEKMMVGKTAELEDGTVVGVFEFDSTGANKATENIGKLIGAYETDNNQKKTTIRVEVTD